MPRGQVQKNGPLRQRLAVAALLLLYFLLAVTSLWNKSVTVDEYAHLAAACAVLQQGVRTRPPWRGGTAGTSVWRRRWLGS